MDKNPYNALISEIRDISKANIKDYFYLGKVVSPLPNLEIRTHNIIIDKSNIMIDKWLIDRHNELVDKTEGEHSHGTCTGGGGTGSGNHTHTSDAYVDILTPGDTVAMLRINDTFCIISKVVRI